ncbi:MAG: hypothetical protein WCQ69_08155 [Bacteroidales bacterium]|jgi:hypothetical protein
MKGDEVSWQDEYLTMIDDCIDRESRLTSWEMNFLESVQDWLDNGSRLTDRQVEVLNDIWEKVTARG